MKRRRLVIFLVIVLLLGAGLAFIFRPASVPVETSVIAKGSLQETVEEEGKTRMHDHFTVAATVAGKLRRIHLDAGDAVKENQIIAWIDPAPIDPRQQAILQARLDAARASQKQAEALAARAAADQAQAQKDLDRARQLFQHGIISQEAQERAVTVDSVAAKQAHAADSALEAAKSQVEEARSALLEYHSGPSTLPTPIRAPIDGRVLRLFEKSERVVTPGMPLLEIGFTPRLEIVSDFLTRDAVRIQPEMHALITDWGGAEDIPARVRLVEPGGFTKVSALGVEEQRVNVVCDPIGPTHGLEDAYHVNVQVIVWQGSNVLKVPASAIFRFQKEWAVFLVKNGKAHRTIVQIGHRGSTFWEVTAGLRLGDRVVVHPGADIEDGVRVKESRAAQEAH
ncbi:MULTISPECIES: efflux RND transporter periplasmic adaptor subunit [Acidobacterium]|uniref:Efflux transporter, RND family, MFP subunit n=1 Tax=Acidobacterium capsulatum (strain ATCC 51196 / DSM 11244 / BCRC 80197 / JCM 7670 / NBRC 15755 / NCIMB 13165 / 161) TaxID=240015 RepID=C1F745_ACIC5|nr:MULTISPECIES: efflux RND transporter periplasmic adaptor subunit [Acidobacterium]ACO32357.1 efflux transporter, RND family, MFP subunit [Acidobacterium capsulatum ATCC 51196]HCT60980.1 efflux RND transporter periplasmic adaptor subunit [Acidobacterium sp.]